MQNSVPGLPCLATARVTLGALAPYGGYPRSRPARHLSAVHDAWWVILMKRAYQDTGEKLGENSPQRIKRPSEQKR